MTLEVDPSPLAPSDETPALVETLTVALGATAEEQAKLWSNSLLRETEILNVCCFKLLSLGVIFYMATGI